MKKIVLLIGIITTGFSFGQNLFQNDFSTFNTGVQLSGQGNWTNNSSLPGGGGAAVAGGFNVNVVNTLISYLNYGTSENSMQIKPNSDACGTSFTAVTSGNLYVGFVLNLSVVQANNNSDFFRILSDGNYNTSCRLYATPAGGGFYIGTAKGANGNAITFTSNAYNFNQDHLVIIKYSQFSGTSDDVVSVYVDPVFINGEPASPTITTNVGMDQSGSIDRLSFRQNWTNGMPTGNAGLVSVSQTWQDLTFVPLSNQGFSNSNFVIINSEVKSGILLVRSNISLQNVVLNIYDIQGRRIENKNISLSENDNTIAINPVTTAGIYIIEITSEKGKFSQKIVIQ